MTSTIEYDSTRTFTTNTKIYDEFALLTKQKKRKVGHKLTELMLSYIRQVKPDFEV